MFKKVVSSVRAAWNNAVEEFELQQYGHQSQRSSMSFPQHDATSSNFDMSRPHYSAFDKSSNRIRTGVLKPRTFSKGALHANSRSTIGEARRKPTFKTTTDTVLQENEDPSQTEQDPRRASGFKRKASSDRQRSISSRDHQAGLQDALNENGGAEERQHQSKRRKFFKSIGNFSRGRHGNSQSVIEVQSLRKRGDNVKLDEVAAEAEAAAFEDFYGHDTPEETIKHLRIRIHELETLVAQKDQIIKIMRDEIQRPSGATKNETRRLGHRESENYFVYDDTEDEEEQDDESMVLSPYKVPGHNGSAPGEPSISEGISNKLSHTQISRNHIMDPSTARPVSSIFSTMATTDANADTSDDRFDNLIDSQYNQQNTSFEVLSPIAIDVSRFTSS